MGKSKIPRLEGKVLAEAVVYLGKHPAIFDSLIDIDFFDQAYSQVIDELEKSGLADLNDEKLSPLNFKESFEEDTLGGLYLIVKAATLSPSRFYN